MGFFNPHNLLRGTSFWTLYSFAVRQHNKKLLKTHFRFFPCVYFSSIAVPDSCNLPREIKSRLSVTILKKLIPFPWEAVQFSLAVPGRFLHTALWARAAVPKPCPVPALPCDLGRVISPLCLSVPAWPKGIMMVQLLPKGLLLKALCNILHIS